MNAAWLWRIAAATGMVAFLLGGPAWAFRQEAQPVSGEARRAFEQLTGSAPEERAAAFDFLLKSKSGALVPALEAFRNGLLERRSDGTLVIYRSRVEINGSKVFPLVDAWTLNPLTDAAGAPAYADSLGSSMLKSEDADEQNLARLISILSLYHPDPDIRREAIADAANRGDADMLDDLKAALENNPGSALTSTLRESIARIELTHGAGDVRLNAARTLGELGTSGGLDDLRKVLDEAKSSNDTPLTTAIESAIARIDSYQLKVRILKYTFSGLSLGSILVLLALGLSIIFGLMRVINLAHGEFMMVGAYTTYVVAEFFKLHVPAAWFDYYYILALPLAFLVSGLVGWICEATIIRHLYGRTIETLLATWGISLVLIQTARLLFGDTTSLTPPNWFQGGWEVAPDLVFPLNRLFIIAFCGVCVAVVYYLVQGTRFGLLLRATTQDRPIAAALGVPTRWMDGMTFGFGTGLAGLAGATVPLFDKLNPNIGQGYIVDSFMVVVVGGVGKLIGAITAGMSLGFLTQYVEPWLGAIYGKLAVLGLIIVFLQRRPSGLFPHRGRAAED
ncbi:MAG TPA: urea ABC transporter permease subunit UrtB [Terriglobia bacterium]|nr:urea ABC transporter permease subunit UrtB [Terriglobia bacterium]